MLLKLKSELSHKTTGLGHHYPILWTVRVDSMKSVLDGKDWFDEFSWTVRVDSMKLVLDGKVWFDEVTAGR